MKIRLSYVYLVAVLGLTAVTVLENWRPGTVGGVVSLSLVWLVTLAIVAIASWLGHDAPAT